MEAVFLKLLNMSLTASILAAVVMVVRLGLKKAPRWIHCLMWAMVALRLILPFSFESTASLIPEADTIVPSIVIQGEIQLNTNIPVADGQWTVPLPQQGTTSSVPSGTTIDILGLLTAVWLAGVGVMAVYSTVSYLRLRKQVAPSLVLAGDIYLCDYIETPFILGIIRPRIYLPTGMHPSAAAHVLAHERAHIRRLDHWWKPLGFLLLTMHWFNPVIWLAYILLCRDIELACDEKVIKEMGCEDKRSYSEALLRCSVPRRMIAACPLAFGEVGVKERVKNVMKFKKPALWIILAAVVICVIVAVCFLTDPVRGIPLADFQRYEPDDISYVRLTARFAGEKFDTQEDIDRVIAFLEDARYDPEPTSQNRSEDRSKIYEIELNYGAVSVHYYFDIYFTEMWVNDGVKPSLPYRMKDPEAVEEFFSTMLDRKFPPVENAQPTEAIRGTNGSNFFIRGTVMSVSNNLLYVKPLRSTSGLGYFSMPYESWMVFNVPSDYTDELMTGDVIQVNYVPVDSSTSVTGSVASIEIEKKILPNSIRREIQKVLGTDNVTYFSPEVIDTQVVVGVQYGDQFALAYFYNHASGPVLDRVMTTKDLKTTYLDGIYQDPNSPSVKLEIYLVTKSVPLTALPVDSEYNGYHMNTVLSGPSILVRYVSSATSVSVDGIEYSYANTTVSHMYDSSWINLILPLDWEYELRKATEDGDDYSTAIRPRGEEGWITIEYRKDGFTPGQDNIREVDSFLSGHKHVIYKGYREGSELWDYIRFEGYKDKFVVTHEDAPWLEDYQQELLNILSTVELYYNDPS